jgi:hypothetical protein
MKSKNKPVWQPVTIFYLPCRSTMLRHLLFALIWNSPAEEEKFFAYAANLVNVIKGSAAL